MSNRRQARAGTVDPSVKGVPSALGSRNDPIWEDEGKVRALARAHGIGPLVYPEPNSVRFAPRSSSEYLRHPHPWTRFDVFRHAWCIANELEMAGPGRGCIDTSKARAIGIETSTSRLDFFGTGPGSRVRSSSSRVDSAPRRATKG